MTEANKVTLQEFDLPQTSVHRIIKNVLPDNIQLSKDAKAAFTRAAAIFVFYLTHCANDFCRESKRQTIYTQDVINALRETGFEDFIQPLEEFLEVYRMEGETKKQNKKDASNATDALADQDGEGTADDQRIGDEQVVDEDEGYEEA